jgi:hypothetical protein
MMQQQQQLLFQTVNSLPLDQLFPLKDIESVSISNSNRTTTDASHQRRQWLCDCSHDGRVLICARERTALVVRNTTAVGSQSSPAKKATVNPILNHCTEADWITQVLLLPLFSSSKREEPIRYCVVLGYQSGVIKIFALVHDDVNRFLSFFLSLLVPPYSLL